MVGGKMELCHFLFLLLLHTQQPVRVGVGNWEVSWFDSSGMWQQWDAGGKVAAAENRLFVSILL